MFTRRTTGRVRESTPFRDWHSPIVYTHILLTDSSTRFLVGISFEADALCDENLCHADCHRVFFQRHSRCRSSSAHIRQPRPDCALDLSHFPGTRLENISSCSHFARQRFWGRGEGALFHSNSLSISRSLARALSLSLSLSLSL